jgi:hypothetical protein
MALARAGHHDDLVRAAILNDLEFGVQFADLAGAEEIRAIHDPPGECREGWFDEGMLLSIMGGLAPCQRPRRGRQDKH